MQGEALGGRFPTDQPVPGLEVSARPNLWMVGDSIFLGQSVAATALGGLRVSDMILQEHYKIRHGTGLNWADSS